MFGDLFKKKKTNRPQVRVAPKLTPQQLAETQALENMVEEEIELSGLPEPMYHAPRRGKTKSKPSRASVRFTFVWLGLWCLVAASAVFSRTAWLPEEARLLSMAWDMWQAKDFVLPLYNGEVVLTTSPVFLWVLHAGWAVFGVNDWWPRLVPPLCGLFILIGMYMLSRVLWPGRADVRRYSPLLLLSIWSWSLFGGLILADVVFILLIVVVMWSLAQMGRNNSFMALLPFTLFMGLAILSGGFTVFLFVLPAALLAPFWVSDDKAVSAGVYYMKVFVGAVGALLIAGVWFGMLYKRIGSEALVTALKGYLSPQTLSFFPYVDVWWGYLLLIPIILLPWSVYPLGWLRLWHVREGKTDRGMLFCILWGIPALIVLSLLSVKQPHYLLPLVPPFALTMTYLLMDDDLAGTGEDSVFAGMGVPVILIGGLLSLLPNFQKVSFLPDMLWSFPPLAGLVLALVGIALAWLPNVSIRKRLVNISSISIVGVVLGSLLLGWYTDNRYTVSGLATTLKEVEDQGRPIAFIGQYDGQFHFRGRLRNPFTILKKEEAPLWAQHYSNGLVLAYREQWQPPGQAGLHPVTEGIYNQRPIAFWDAQRIVE